MNKRFTGRAERIKAYLIKHGSATMAELHQECGDGELRNTSSTVYQLVSGGKARRTNSGRSAVFHPTALTLHDGRGKSTSRSQQAAPRERAATPRKPAASAEQSLWAFGGKTRTEGTTAPRPSTSSPTSKPATAAWPTPATSAPWHAAGDWSARPRTYCATPC